MAAARAVRVYGAAMAADQVAHDCEAEAQAAVERVALAIGLHERFEDAAELIGRDAAAVVAHGDPNPPRQARALDEHVDLSARGVNFAALVSRFPKIWASRSGSPCSVTPSGSSFTWKACRWRIMSGAAISTARSSTAVSDSASLRSSTWPRVTREMSSSAIVVVAVV